MKVSKLVKILLVGLVGIIVAIVAFSLLIFLPLMKKQHLPFLGGTLYVTYSTLGGCFDICDGKDTQVYCRSNNNYTDFYPVVGPCVHFCRGQYRNTCEKNRPVLEQNVYDKSIVDEVKKDGWDLTKSCVEKRTCGNIVELDCNSAGDGPLYYINKVEQKILEKCGGWCRIPPDIPSEVYPYCKECPPKIWKCQ